MRSSQLIRRWSFLGRKAIFFQFKLADGIRLAGGFRTDDEVKSADKGKSAYQLIRRWSSDRRD